MKQKPIFYYAQQRIAVERACDLLGIDRRRLRPCDPSGEGMMGQEFGLYMDISDHPERSARIWEMVRDRGMEIITIDDRWSRNRAYQKQRQHYPS